MRLESSANFLSSRMGGIIVHDNQIPALVPITGMAQADWDKMPLKAKKNLMTAMNLKGMTEGTVTAIDEALAKQKINLQINKESQKEKSIIPILAIGAAGVLVLFLLLKRKGNKR